MEEDEGKAIRFGIMGCANIARKVSRAIRLAPNARLAAVASRSVEKARGFAAENGFPEDVSIYGSYQEILEDRTVEVLYIPLPTSLHRRWVVEAASKGKHVLLEKPTALSVSELDEMLGACESAGVQFMDATMWMHHPRTARMRELLSNSALFGELKWVQSIFTYATDEHFIKNDIRVKPDLDALGALGDTGWYCIRAILWAADYELPKTVTAIQGTVFNDAGVNLASGSSLKWDDGKAATFYCSFFNCDTSIDVSVHGSKGTLRLHDFVIPFEESCASFTFSSGMRFDDLWTGWSSKPSEENVHTNLPQEACMVKEFARLVSAIRDSGLKPDSRWPSITRKTQLVLDAVKASIDKGFVPVLL